VAAVLLSRQGSTEGVVVSSLAVVLGDVGGSCEVEAPRSPFRSGGGGCALPFDRGGTGGRDVPLLVHGAELDAPWALPLVPHGPEEWAI